MAAGEIFTTPSKHITKMTKKAIIAIRRLPKSSKKSKNVGFQALICSIGAAKLEHLPFLCPFWDKLPADSIKSPSDLEISLFILKFYQ